MDTVGIGEIYHMVVFIVGANVRRAFGLTVRYKVINCKEDMTHNIRDGVIT